MDPAGILPSAKLWHHVVGPSKYGLTPICYLLFVAQKKMSLNRNGSMSSLFTVHYRLATPLCLCSRKPTSSQNQTTLEAIHFVAGMCQVEIRGLPTL